jgi:hypothetical protein
MFVGYNLKALHYPSVCNCWHKLYFVSNVCRRSSETSVNKIPTRRHIPEDDILLISTFAWRRRKPKKRRVEMPGRRNFQIHWLLVPWGVPALLHGLCTGCCAPPVELKGPLCSFWASPWRSNGNNSLSSSILSNLRLCVLLRRSHLFLQGAFRRQVLFRKGMFL